MQLFTFGLNHQTAPLDVRERVVFNADTIEPALRDLVDLSSTVGSEAWNSRDLKSRPH